MAGQSSSIIGQSGGEQSGLSFLQEVFQTCLIFFFGLQIIMDSWRGTTIVVGLRSLLNHHQPRPPSVLFNELIVMMIMMIKTWTKMMMVIQKGNTKRIMEPRWMGTMKIWMSSTLPTPFWK